MGCADPAGGGDLTTRGSAMGSRDAEGCDNVVGCGDFLGFGGAMARVFGELSAARRCLQKYFQNAPGSKRKNGQQQRRTCSSTHSERGGGPAVFENASRGERVHALATLRCGESMVGPRWIVLGIARKETPNAESVAMWGLLARRSAESGPAASPAPTIRSCWIPGECSNIGKLTHVPKFRGCEIAPSPDDMP